MLINGKRALAYIQNVVKVEPIVGADNIELVTILGWKCISKKGEFKEGDKCIYFEIDSKLPASDERFEFMARKDYKVKTYKLNKFGVIGQGLALPLVEFPELADLDINTDVTDKLGVTYSEPEDNMRKAPDGNWVSLQARKPKLFKRKVVKWLAKHQWGRRLILKLWGSKEDSKGFPINYCEKTDEERINNCPYLLEDKQPYIVTEKLDGTSSTYVLVRHRHWYGTRYEFIVSSRNVRQQNEDQACYHDYNIYWAMAKKYDLENKMKEMLKDIPGADYVVLQGESIGKVQGNPYKLKEDDIYFFNLIDNRSGKWSTDEAAKFVSNYGLKWVPIIDCNYTLPDTVDELLTAATGNSIVNPNVLREGWVIRRKDDNSVISFKAVSPEYLIKNKK